MTDSRVAILLFWFLLMLLAGYQVLQRTTVSSDMSVFMPTAQTRQPDPLITQLMEGPAARIWLLALAGDSAKKLAAISTRLAAALRRSDRFVTVMNGASWLDEAGRKLLFRYRYLLDPRVDRDYFSVPSLHAALQQRLRELASPLSIVTRRLLPADPTAALPEILNTLGRETAGLNYFKGVWFSPGRQRALLVAETHARGLDLAAQQAVMDQIASDLQQAAPNANIRLQLAGAPYIALQIRDRIRAESRRLSLWAGGFTLLFILWVYRSLRRLLLSTIPLLGGLLFATATVSLLFGSVHGIALAFGVTILGVAVDYPVHLLSHNHAGENLSTTLRRIWPTLRLGAATTVLGYVAMTFTGFTGLAQLGVFSIAGLASAALLTRSLLPALMISIPARPMRLTALASILTRRSPRWLLALTIAGTVLVMLLLARTQDYWSEDIADLSPIPSNLRQQDRVLRSQLGAPENRYLLTVEADRLETLLQREETLRPRLQAAVTDHAVQDFMMAARLLPSEQQQAARQAALPDSATLQQHLVAALADLPFKAGLFKPFVQDVAASRNLPFLQATQLRQSGLALQLDNLVFSHDGRMTGLVRLAGVEDPVALQHLADGLPGVRFIDVRRSASNLVNRFRRETLQRISWATAVIVLVLWLGLRDPHRLWRVLVPVGMAVMLAAAVPLGLGEKLNLFHLVSLLLVAGIGLDYSLFFSRHSSRADDRLTTHALLVCSISTAAVFGMLATSAIPVLHYIGITVTTGVISAFFLAWLIARPQPEF